MKWWRRFWRGAGAVLAVAVAAQVGLGADPVAVASAYAGQPVQLVRGANGLDGWAEPGRIHLHPALYDALHDPDVFRPGRPDRPWQPDRSSRAVDVDAVALQTLLHEASHLRWPDAPEGAVDCAAFLLFPGALDRFYGVPLGSTAGTRLWWFHAYTFDCGWFAWKR